MLTRPTLLLSIAAICSTASIVIKHPILIGVTLILVAYVSYEFGREEGLWEATNPDFEETLRKIDEELAEKGE